MSWPAAWLMIIKLSNSFGFHSIMNSSDKSFSSADGIPEKNLTGCFQQYFCDRKKYLLHMGVKYSLDANLKYDDWIHKQAGALCDKVFSLRQEPKDGNHILSEHFLVNVLHDFAEEHRFHSSAEDFVEKMRRKYEVFSRIAVRYDMNYRKVGEEWVSGATYALLAFVFLCRFSMDYDYRLLNAALKLNDRLIKTDILSSDTTAVLLESSFLAEVVVIKSLIGKV